MSLHAKGLLLEKRQPFQNSAGATAGLLKVRTSDHQYPASTML